MANIALTSIGVKISYATELTSGLYHKAKVTDDGALKIIASGTPKANEVLLTTVNQSGKYDATDDMGNTWTPKENDYTILSTRPISGYTHITGLRSTPDFNQAPNTGDGTTFENKTYTTKVPLLRELPDSLEFGAVLGQEFFDKWADLVDAFDTAKTTNKSIWFCIDIPGLKQSMYFEGEPISMGLPAMEQNSVIESPVYIVPTGEPVLSHDPEYGVVGE